MSGKFHPGMLGLLDLEDEGFEAASFTRIREMIRRGEPEEAING
jgi:hypothetical protein